MIFWITYFSAWAQEVSLQVQREELMVGVPFVLTVLATDFEEGSTPQVSDWSIEGLQIDYLGVEPNVSRRTSIINGHRRDDVDVRYAFQYRILASKKGTYKIPNIIVTQDDLSAQSNPAQFSVQEAPISNDMAIELLLPSKDVWVGQTIPLEINVFLLRDIGDLDIIVPLFDLLPVEAPQNIANTQSISISTSKGELRLPYVQDSAVRNGKDYARIRILAQSTLSKAGNLHIDPTRIVANLVVGQQRGFMGFAQNRYQLFQAKDQSRDLVIKPLPLQNQPKSFSGAVGENFSIQVSAKRTVVAVGEPMMVEVEIKGKDNLDGIGLPNLEGMGLDANVFDLPTQKILGEQIDESTKRFSIALRLKNAQAREIPRLDFAFFDPIAQSYKHAYSEPVALSVTGSVLVTADQVQTANTTPSSSVKKDDAALFQSQSLMNVNFALSTPQSQNGRPLSKSQILVGLLLGHIGIILGLFVFNWRSQTQDQRTEKSHKKIHQKQMMQLLHRAQKEPCMQISKEVLQELQQLKIQEPDKKVLIEELIQLMELQRYNPDLQNQPFAPTILDKWKDLLAVLLLCWAALWTPLNAHANTPEILPDQILQLSGREAYEMALTVEDFQSKKSLFTQAMQAFEKEIQLGDSQNPNLWEDFGNAALGATDLGKAAFAYHQALNLDASSPRARQNVQWIENQLPSWAQSTQQQSMLEGMIFWKDVLSFEIQGLLTILVFAMIPLMWKRMPILSQLLFPVWLLLWMGLLSNSWHQLEGVVLVNTGHLHSADNQNAPLVRSEYLPAGILVEILQTQDDWYQIRLKNGDKGWVLAKDIALLISM